jgi:hypothetical protein
MLYHQFFACAQKMKQKRILDPLTLPEKLAALLNMQIQMEETSSVLFKKNILSSYLTYVQTECVRK